MMEMIKIFKVADAVQKKMSIRGLKYFFSRFFETLKFDLRGVKIFLISR